MTKPVVIGVDGSDASAAALSWGLDWAAHHQADVILLQIADDSFLSDRAVFRSESERVSMTLLEWGMNIAREHGFSGSIEGIAKVGHPVEQFEQFSANASLIVLGDHTGSKLTTAFFGSRSVKIAAVSQCPVAVIPVRGSIATTGVVVGVDGSEQSEHAVRIAADEASRLGLDLTAVYAWMPPLTPGLEQVWSQELLDVQHKVAEESLAIATAGLADRYPDVVVHRKVVQAPPVAALESEAQNAALLVVGSRGRGGMARLLLGSVAQGVLNTPPTAVIVTR